MDLNPKEVLAELAALKVVCCALIASHPDKSEFGRVLQKLQERSYVKILYQDVDDEVLAAIEKRLDFFSKPFQNQ